KSEPMRFDQLSPPMPAEFPPPGRQIAGPRMIDLEQLGAECSRPKREDALDTIAGEPRTKQARCRQTAPGRLLNIAIPARCVAETTVSAEISVMAVGSH